MVEFLPFLLILLGWQADAPGDAVELATVLTFDEAQCRAKGEAMVAEQQAATRPAGGDRRYRYFCTPAPTGEEYQRVFEQSR